MLVLHRTREMLVRQRTMLINAIRGHCAEFGMIAPQGARRADELVEQLCQAEADLIPDLARSALLTLAGQLETRAHSPADRGVATLETSEPKDTVNLSPTAERLTRARENLAVRERSPETCSVAEWVRLQGDATVTTDRRPAADQKIAALERTDAEHAHR